MKMILKCLLILSVVLAARYSSAQAGVANAKPLNDCYANCGLFQRVGNSLTVTLLDKAGKPFKLVSWDLAPEATNLSVTTSQSVGMSTMGAATASTAGGVYTQTQTTIYETPTHTIIVTVTFVYRSSDNKLIDVIINERRIDKKQIQ